MKPLINASLNASEMPDLLENSHIQILENRSYFMRNQTRVVILFREKLSVTGVSFRISD